MINNVPSLDIAFSITPPARRIQLTQSKRIITGFSLFETGIEPEWEDPAHRDSLVVWACKHVPDAIVTEAWQDLMLACIGETLTPVTGYVTGVRTTYKAANARFNRQVKMEAWMVNADGLASAHALQANVVPTASPRLRFVAQHVTAHENSRSAPKE